MSEEGDRKRALRGDPTDRLVHARQGTQAEALRSTEQIRVVKQEQWSTAEYSHLSAENMMGAHLTFGQLAAVKDGTLFTLHTQRLSYSEWEASQYARRVLAFLSSSPHH